LIPEVRLPCPVCKGLGCEACEGQGTVKACTWCNGSGYDSAIRKIYKDRVKPKLTVIS
jgi:DnaJ-class molecular chaperone